MKQAARHIALLGITTSLALIFAYVEVLLPPLVSAVPGIKMGLANIVILFVLYRFGWKRAALVSALRILLASLLFGSFTAFLYSAAGAFLSLVGMALLKRVDVLSPVGVSVAGGVLHNVGQILMAMLLLTTTELLYYLVVLVITGTLSGVLIGIAGGLIVKRLPKTSFE